MKLSLALGAWALGAVMPLSLHAIPTFGGMVNASHTATFDSLDPNGQLGSTYTEGGIWFGSASDFAIINGYFGAVCFGGGGYIYEGNALRILSNDWAEVSIPGQVMGGIQFSYGFDWNFHAIEYGLLETAFAWQAWRGDAMVGSGVEAGGRTHGGFDVSITDTGPGFDRLLISSNATAWNGTWNPATGGYERGEIIGYGDANHIAFDSVRVQCVPDGGITAALLATAVLGLLLVRRGRAQPPIE
jgi:hypothetical protein